MKAGCSDTAVYRIFSQHRELEVDLAGIVNNARRYFEASVEVVESSRPEPGSGSIRSARLELRNEPRSFRGCFTVTARAATEHDYQTAEVAEARGRAAGMGALARRCPTIWDLEPDPGTPEPATLNLCALLAATALGPVLPPDTSTLLGVRSAMLRVEELLGIEPLKT